MPAVIIINRHDIFVCTFKLLYRQLYTSADIYVSWTNRLSVFFKCTLQAPVKT